MVILASTECACQGDVQPNVRYAELLPEDVKWCVVSLSDVMNANKRLEATVFDVKGKHAREIVANCKWGSVPLCGAEGLATAYVCGRFKRIWVESSDLPIYQPASITNIKPNPDGFLSKVTMTDFDALRVQHGQILLTCSGTIGKVSLVSATLNEKIFSHDLIRMNVKNPNDIGTVYAFLRSDIGNTIIQTNNYGAVVQHIEPEHLDKVCIPNPSDVVKERINNLIMRSFALRDESNTLIDQATKLLINELELPQIDEIITTRLDNRVEVNNYGIKLSELSGRLEGSYHTPIVKAIGERLRKRADEVTTVGDKRVSRDILLPGRFKRVYVEKGQGQVFFSGKDMMELDPFDKKYLSFSQHSKRIKEQLTIHQNMILVTCSGTVGNAVIVPKHWNNWTMTHDLIRLIPELELEGYLFIWLQTPHARKLIESMAYGSVVPHIEIEHIEQIPVPILKDKEVQVKINSLALEANELRHQAHQLEQEAMKIMDNEVFFA